MITLINEMMLAYQKQLASKGSKIRVRYQLVLFITLLSILFTQDSLDNMHVLAA